MLFSTYNVKKKRHYFEEISIIDLRCTEIDFRFEEKKSTQIVVKFQDYPVLSDVETDNIRRAVLVFGTRYVWLVHYCCDLTARPLDFV